MRLVYVAVLILLTVLVLAWASGFLALASPTFKALDLLDNKARAESLQDFRDMTELEQFLELGSMTVLRPESCTSNVDTFIQASRVNGYRVERFIITSTDYYKYWYNAELPAREAHGVAWVSVAGKPWLVEPTIPMAWELTVGWAGRKVGVAWE